MKNKHTKTRMKFIVTAGVAFLVLFAGIVLLSRVISEKKEPLTPDQILAKENWTKEELADTLTRVALQRHGRDKKMPGEVYEHIRVQVDKLPEKERDEVAVQTIKNTIDKGLDLIRAMEPEKRKKLVARMREEAEGNRIVAEDIANNPQNLTPEEKKQLAEIREKTKEIYSETVNESMLNKMTPEERRELAPVVKEWVGTLENLQ